MKKIVNLKSIIVAVAIVYTAYVFISTQITINKIKSEIVVNKQELEKLQEKNQKLQDEINLSKTNSYIEKLAREKLHMIKQGETPVINNNKK